MLEKEARAERLKWIGDAKVVGLRTANAPDKVEYCGVVIEKDGLNRILYIRLATKRSWLPPFREVIVKAYLDVEEYW